MNKTLLITFGCSWTYGVGVGYRPGMSREEYRAIAWDWQLGDQLSFRGLLSKKFNLDNLNFASGGNSNQKQFWCAKEYFTSGQFVHHQKRYDNIVVMHAITSTARNYFYDIEQDIVVNVNYNDSSKFAKFMVAHGYNHNFEVKQLTLEMLFWNMFYKKAGIKNIWIDTFNHHDYTSDIYNLVNNNYTNRDLLSQLCLHNHQDVTDNNYHISHWVNDTSRVSSLVSIGLLNPISYHPTAECHTQIADMLEPSFKLNLLN